MTLFSKAAMTTLLPARENWSRSTTRVHRRWLHTTWKMWSHENPLGLPRTSDPPRPPTIPQRSRTGAPPKRALPNVHNVLAISSCKGGVGKSTVSTNLALALSLLHSLSDDAQKVRGTNTTTTTINTSSSSSSSLGRKLRVGLLDLDIFGPSVPKLMGLDRGAMGAQVTKSGALIPLINHSLPTMSISYLLSPEQASSPIVWRGLMVQKAVQQLLFDVDWRTGAKAEYSIGEGASSSSDGDDDSHHGGGEGEGRGGGEGLDVLVIDMPPGTGDVALTLTQLVKIDGAVVVSTPQEVALEDTRKGVEMFRKVGVEPTGLILNMAHYIPPPPLPQDPLPLFGSPEPFLRLASNLQLPVLGQIPLEPAVSAGGDSGWPVTVRGEEQGGVTRRVFIDVASKVWEALLNSKSNGDGKT